MEILECKFTSPDGRLIKDIAVEKSEREIGAGRLISFRISNRGSEERIAFALPLRLKYETTAAPENIRFFINGYNSFSGSGSFHMGEKEIETLIPNLRQVHRNFHIPREKKAGRFSSSLCGVLQVPGLPCVTVGCTDSREFSTQITADWKAGAVLLEARVQMEGRLLKKGQTIALPEIYLAETEEGDDLSEFTQRLSENMRADKWRRIPAGWCTWYHYFTNIDEKEFLKNLDLAHDFLPQGSVFQLDDGYTNGLGDWTGTNKKFSSGLKFLAERIQQAGFVPGIWTAPFIATEDTPFVRENPERLLRDSKGRPVKCMWNPNWGIFKYPYCLNVSRPDVREHLRETFQTLYDWGIRFFKLDFLFAATLPGDYYEKEKTSIQIIRESLGLIREVVRDSYILGCGCPLEGGVGIVDSMRIGNDVTPYWSNYVDGIIGGGFEQLSTRNSIRNTLARSFMQGKLFHSDPDCLITRKTDNKLSEVEMKTLANVNALSGGPVMISDNLSALDDNSRGLLKTAFALSKELGERGWEFSSPDLLDRRIPELQLARKSGEALLGVYNFGEKPGRHQIDIAQLLDWPECRVSFYESGLPVDLDQGILNTDMLPPHGSVIYRIKAN